MEKPRLSFWQIWNMSFGFMGIQFGWGLQMANMSPIYAKLGANPDEIAFLWLAAPMTGLIVQPIIGSMSDRTWNRLGRRRPYFLVGAILSSLALLIMPNSSAIWMAAGLLWILDASINISMEPFRAFVADKLPFYQRTDGFVMQSFFIGIGASVASALPYLFRWMGVSGNTTSGIPLTVKYSFYLGAFAFIGAVLWTIFTSPEYPPEDLAAFERQKRESKGVTYFAQEITAAIREMPTTMKQLAVVQISTWLGLFCMWLFFGLATAKHVFGATDTKSQLFDEGAEWGGICFMVYSIVTFIVSFALPGFAARTNRKFVHTVSLLCGAIGLMSVWFIHDKNILLLTMVGVGIAWASILSMPYAILSGALPPQRMGLYMGIFNFFIVIPEITAALTFKPIVGYLFNNSEVAVVVMGGAFLALAALLTQFVKDVGDEKVATEMASAAAD
ncbi:MAG: MFS transporter [Blastocatellales bacterium]